jgi:hypothetical protein
VHFAPKDPVHNFYKIYGNQTRFRTDNTKSKKDLKNSSSNNKLSPYMKSKNRKSSPEHIDLSIRIIQKHNK